MQDASPSPSPYVLKTGTVLPVGFIIHRARDHTYSEMEPLTEAFSTLLNGTKFATHFLTKYGHPELLSQA